jgi:hypothetical protein
MGSERSTMAARETRTALAAVAILCSLLLAGCISPDPQGPNPNDPRPVAVAGIEVRYLESSNPDPEFDATCQTGAAVRLTAGRSHDPLGQPLFYEWFDVADGLPTADFRPDTNPFTTREPEVGTILATIGVHEITLTVTAADGRQGSTTLRVLVLPCECGG